MSTFAQSQTIFQSQPSIMKLKKNLSIKTTFSSKRGLSLVSQRSKSKGKVSNVSRALNGSQELGCKRKRINILGCSINSCQIQKLTQHQQQIEIKQNRKLSFNLRHRNSKMSNRNYVFDLNPTSDSFRSSKVQSLWNVDSPINKILSNQH